MKNAFIFVLFFAFASCQTKDSAEFVYCKTIQTPTIELPGSSTILNRTYPFTSPREIIVSDSILAIYDPINQLYPIHVFDTTGRFLHTLGTKGKGPGELISPRIPKYDQQAKTLHIYDWSAQKIVHYPLQNTNGPYFTETKPETDIFSVFDVYPLQNARYLLLNNCPDARLSVLHHDSLFIVPSPLPQLVENVEENISIWLYSYRSALKPDCSKLAIGTYIGTVLEILDIATLDSITETAILPISPPIYGIAEGARPTWVTPQENTIIGFVSLFGTDRYIYAVMKNDRITADTDATKHADNHIYVFDWDGTPKCKLKLDRYVFTIAVDEQAGKIYAFSYSNPEDGAELICFDFDLNLLRQ